jgi:hypothetical protein
MARTSLNELLESNRAPVALNFVFTEYADAKKAQRRGGESGKFRMKKDGKELPTPNEIVGLLAKHKVKGAYSLSSRYNGAVQELTFADDKEAKTFIEAFKGSPSQASVPKPFKAMFNVEIKLAGQINMAKSIGLL